MLSLLVKKGIKEDMDGRFYQGSGLNIEQITYNFERIFLAQGYQVQHIGDRKQMVIQMRQGSDLEALIGLQAALTITLQSGPNGVTAMMGQQQWLEKAAVGAVGMLLLWPLMLTSGAGVIRQVQLEGQVLSTLDAVVLQQSADVHIGPLPAQPTDYGQPQQRPPQAERQAYTGTGQKACTNCNALNDADDAYCSTCGKPLTVQKRRCPQCQAEVKPGAAFCPKCGTAMA